MNKVKAKRLYRMLDDMVKELPWLKWSLIREAATRVWVLQHEVNTGNKWVFQQMKQECQEIGKALGVSWQTVFSYQCVYDFTQRGPGIASACTVGSVGPYFIRFMDWAVPEGIGKLAEKTKMKADDGSPFISIGFSGFIGTVTAFGEGWAVAMNQSPVTGTNGSGVPSCYYTRVFANRFAVRVGRGEQLKKAVTTILEEFEEENIRPMSSCILIVRNATHHGFVEFIPGQSPVSVVSPVATPLAVSNHLNAKQHLEFNPDDEWEDEDGDVWDNDTYDRQCEMKAVLRKLSKQCTVDLEKVFSNIEEPILNDLTAYAVLKDFSTGEMLVRKE